MKAYNLLLGLILLVQPGKLQRCREITSRVCDENSSNGASQKGEKGEIGASGKAGPPGSKGSKGELGERGGIGESCALGSLGTEILNKFAELIVPTSCLTSSVYGRQTLRSGEEVFCDGGWTIIQRRNDGSVDFQQTWDQYVSGFGNLDGEFWWGLEKIHQLTNGRGCRLRVDLWDFDDDHRFASYSDFSVEGENDSYRLHVDGYSGTAGNGLTGGHSQNGMGFTAIDRDNDQFGSNCASRFGRGSGGWWFNNCLHASPNAVWGRSEGDWANILWYEWKGKNEALKATTLKLRCD
ncbi:unnamed protein product [Clavelina lepadiformis]|uniref:Fibrinogen C-terminal domain-containing protein n=1 Tax=Clavelina lepadiformis TaxID=159417 RepID=A0ABP0GAA0_CLALP